MNTFSTLNANNTINMIWYEDMQRLSPMTLPLIFLPPASIAYRMLLVSTDEINVIVTASRYPFVQQATVLGLIKVNVADNVLHLLIAIVSLGVFFLAGSPSQRGIANA